MRPAQRQSQDAGPAVDAAGARAGPAHRSEGDAWPGRKPGRTTHRAERRRRRSRRGGAPRPRLRPTACRRSRLTGPPSPARLQGSGPRLNRARDCRTRTIPSEPPRRRRGRLPRASVVPIGARGARGRRAEARQGRLLAGEDVAAELQHPRNKSIPSAVSAEALTRRTVFAWGAVAGYARGRLIVQRAYRPESLHPCLCTGLRRRDPSTQCPAGPGRGGRPGESSTCLGRRLYASVGVFRYRPKVLLRNLSGFDQSRRRPLPTSGPPWPPRAARHTVRDGRLSLPGASRSPQLDFGPIDDVRVTSRHSRAIARGARPGCDQSRIVAATTGTYARGALGP